jgi:PilZ domain
MTSSTNMEHRRAQRYDLHLPIELVRRWHLPTSGFGETRNVSSGGVLFKFDAKLQIGDSLEYFITLSAPQGSAQVVRVRCRGKVMRVVRNGEVAVTIERYEFVRADRESPGSYGVASVVDISSGI